MRLRTFIWLCLLPLALVVLAFFVLPMLRLMLVGASGPLGLSAYAAILFEPRYRATLINTVVLAAVTTLVTLLIATIAGLFLQRQRFPGRAVLVAMLTFPLAFPGVVIGFLNPLRVHRDVILPALGPAFVASGAIAFATAMGAFGTAFTLATNIDVLPMLIYTEFTLSANIAMAAALSVGLGLVAWAILAIARSFGGSTVAAAG
jgi:putative spermidine/putrescine transport system permease protein